MTAPVQIDLLIRGGTVVDGSGAPPFAGDVAIRDGRIIAIGTFDPTEYEAVDTLDASGCIVTPGFVDIHTHYDGQAIWSDRLQPSTLHGVSTVVTGNCGVGFAPCRAADRTALIDLMEGVEDIPGAVMAEGLDWSWESFGEYLDALEARPHDCDVAAYLPHSPLRVFVMGERGIRREAATEDDLARMRALVAEAMAAGAMGCATSRLFFHRTAEGELIPTFNAPEAELDALAAGMSDAGHGLLQVVPNYETPAIEDELTLLAQVAERHGIAVTFTGTAGADPARMLDPLSAYRAQGLDITAQIFPRPIGMVVGLSTSWNPFSFCPSFTELAPLDAAARAERMMDPDLRARLVSEEPDAARFPLSRQARNFARMYPMQQGFDYEPALGESVADRAAVRGVTPQEEAYDWLTREEGGQMLLVAMGNFADGTLDTVGRMITHEATVVALGDGGAHYGLICDASYPTTTLTHWVRDRPHGRLPVETAIHQLSRRPAEVVGLLDRGLLAPGYRADINVIDHSALTLHRPEPVTDLPAGGKRLMQRADGYRAAIVAGQVTYRDGIATGAQPGRLVRGPQPAVAAA